MFGPALVSYGEAGKAGQRLAWIGGFRQARQCEDWKGVDWSGRYGGDGYGKFWLVEAGRAGFGGDWIG